MSDAGMERAIELIRENQRTKDPFLDLGNLGLTELPEELFELDHLHNLNLGSYYTEEGKQKKSQTEGPKNRIGIISNGIASLTKLTSLSFSSNQIEDGSPLSALNNLTYLDLSYNQIQEISFLSTLTRLTELNLSDNKIQEISFLSALTNLTNLNLNSNQIKECSFLSGLIHLTKLNLSSNEIENYSFLSNLTSLTKLDLGGNQIRNISFLNNLKTLTNLNLSNNQVRDISFLSNLINLTELDLWENQVDNISFLSNLTNLTKLDLNNNQIEDYSFLNHLTSLTELDLGDNKISNISFVSNLTTLTNLNLGFNQIENISFLSSLTNLTKLDLSFNQIEDITFLSSLTNLTELDLSDNQIHDISFLRDLSSLTELNLWGNQVEDISFLSALTNLTELDLSSNQIQDISFLINLATLTNLNLGFNQIEDFSPLSTLTNLTNLSLSSNQTQDYSFLSNLTNLTNLNLSSNQIQDYSFLSNLTNLTDLNLSSNQIEDYSFLSDLTNLTDLNLSSNQIEDYSFLSDLTNLTDLDLSSNQIEDFSFLRDLVNLTSLNLSSNQIEDISLISNLTNLWFLNLSYNQIRETSSLSNLSNLFYLDLSENEIQEFPKFTIEFKKSCRVHLYGNPISDLPEELLGEWDFENCLPDARAWFADLEKGSKENHELKLILIGNGRVGKSSLVDQLLGEEFDPEKSSTHAIQNEEWHPRGKRHPLKVNIWDFGGQDIYHGTHRLFLQSRALYLVVWDAGNENEKEVELTTNEGKKILFKNHPLRYWLEYVEALSKDSPIIIVQNKIDEKKDFTPAASDSQLYTSSIQVSAKEGGFRVEYLKETILEKLEDMREYGQEMPKSWYEVREDLRKRATDEEALDYDGYLAICEAHGVSNTARSLLSFLHHTGVVYYQKGLFNNQLILNQKWAIEAVYSLLNWQEEHFRLVEAGKGWFDQRILEEVWCDYSEEERKVILSYMESCELCFKINDSEEAPLFVIPQLLAKSPDLNIEDVWEVRYESALHLVYRLPFLHEALIHRFITRAGRLTEPRGMWRGGISIKHNRNYARIEAKGNKEIHVWINGPQRKDLLDRIRNTFQKLFKGYENVERLVGFGHGKLVYLEEAEQYRHKEEVATADRSGFVKTEPLGDFFESDQETELEKIVPPAPSKPPANLYLSWSGSEADRELYEQCLTHFSLFKRQGKLQIWDGTQVTAGKDRQASRTRSWEQADFYAVLLSADYINDAGCFKEMERLVSDSEEKTRDFIPIIGRPCSYNLLPIGGFQALPKDGRAITQQSDEDTAWTEIVKEINLVLVKLGW